MIYLIAGGRNSGKTTRLKEIYKDEKGLGFYSQKVLQENKLIGYDLVSMDEKHRFPFIRLHHIDFTQKECFYNKRFKFDLSVIKEVEKIVLKSGEKTIYLDEIGKLELKFKEGFYSLLKTLLKKDIQIFLTVNSENIEELQSEINKEYTILHTTSIGAVIMASGSSKRFGQENKLLHIEKGQSIFGHVLNTVIESNVFSQILVVTRYDKIKKISNQYQQVEVVQNNHAIAGISESIKLGTKKMKSYLDGYMYIPSDQLYLKKDTLRKLNAAFKGNKDKIIVPLYKNVVGSPKIFPAHLREDLLSLEGDIGGRQVIENNKDILCSIYLQEEQDNWDINTVEDLRRF